MKKQAKGIIALSAVLAAMLGGGFAYMKLNPGEEGSRRGDSSSSSPTLLATEARGQGTVLVSDNGETGIVKSVTVKNSSGELNVIMQSGPDEESGTGAVYTLNGYTDLDVCQYIICRKILVLCSCFRGELSMLLRCPQACPALL